MIGKFVLYSKRLFFFATVNYYDSPVQTKPNNFSIIIAVCLQPQAALSFSKKCIVFSKKTIFQ